MSPRSMKEDYTEAFRAVVTETSQYKDKEPYVRVNYYGPYALAAVARGIITGASYSQSSAYGSRSAEGKIQRTSIEWVDL